MFASGKGRSVRVQRLWRPKLDLNYLKWANGLRKSATVRWHREPKMHKEETWARIGDFYNLKWVRSCCQTTVYGWKVSQSWANPPWRIATGLRTCTSRGGIFKRFMEPRNRFQGMNFASLCILAGRYNIPIPTRFLAPIDCLKIPALLPQVSKSQSLQGPAK
jgi:hypothetical protein